MYKSSTRVMFGVRDLEARSGLALIIAVGVGSEVTNREWWLQRVPRTSQRGKKKLFSSMWFPEAKGKEILVSISRIRGCMQRSDDTRMVVSKKWWCWRRVLWIEGVKG